MDKLVLWILCTSFSVVVSLRSVAHAVPITSCSQTPYPETCNHYTGNKNNYFLANQHETESSFRDLAIEVAMNQAILAHQLVSSMDLGSFDDQAKAAWHDCLELYEDSVELLNKSMVAKNPKDSQTWLSAALTNHQTCHNGFEELNLVSHLESFPNMLSNFSKLLSNSLAINSYKVDVPSSSLPSKMGIRGRRLLADDLGFPSWVSAADRKLLQATTAVKADIVVDKAGSGNFKTISEAIEASSKRRSGTKRFVIYVKAGVYNENVEIKRSTKYIMIIGDGIDATVVTGSKNSRTGPTTFRTATFAVMGEGFIARDITFQNTAGPENHQAVALRSGSDFSVFYSCSFKGYQDTLYVYSQRQFYRNCDIYGTVDFIFGNAVVVFQNCNIYVRKPMSGQQNTVTAQSRTDPNENTGIIIHNSRVSASSDLRAAQGSFKTYLGRPWKKYSRTVFMKTYLDSLIDPRGWYPWSGSFGLSTLYYGEYMNTGPGASTGGRVSWPGFHVINSATVASKFTVGNFLAGASWIPATGIPFSSGL